MNLLDLPLEMLIEIYKNTSYTSRSFTLLRADLRIHVNILLLKLGEMLIHYLDIIKCK